MNVHVNGYSVSSSKVDVNTIVVAGAVVFVIHVSCSQGPETAAYTANKRTMGALSTGFVKPRKTVWDCPAVFGISAAPVHGRNRTRDTCMIGDALTAVPLQAIYPRRVSQPNSLESDLSKRTAFSAQTLQVLR